MAVFYARNCGSSIERLCKNNDLFFHIDGNAVSIWIFFSDAVFVSEVKFYFMCFSCPLQFVLRILLQCAPVNRLKLNAHTVMKKFLESRYNEVTRTLDLSNTEHDPGLSFNLLQLT